MRRRIVINQIIFIDIFTDLKRRSFEQLLCQRVNILKHHPFEIIVKSKLDLGEKEFACLIPLSLLPYALRHVLSVNNHSHAVRDSSNHYFVSSASFTEYVDDSLVFFNC